MLYSKRFTIQKKNHSLQLTTQVAKKKDPFEDALDYMELLDEGCEKTTMQYSFETCQSGSCGQSEHHDHHDEHDHVTNDPAIPPKLKHKTKAKRT